MLLPAGLLVCKLWVTLGNRVPSFPGFRHVSGNGLGTADVWQGQRIDEYLVYLDDRVVNPLAALRLPGYDLA